MIKREDILSLEYFKKTEYTGSHEGMRYRIEGVSHDEEKKLLATVWPEPFNFATTPDEQKQHEEFDFSEDGILDVVGWLNDRLFAFHEER